MKTAMTWPLAIFAPAVVIALFNACGTSPKSNGSQQAITTFAITGVDFSGNSVSICGSRTPPADSKYSCDSNLSSDGSCLCFNFAADGTLLGPGMTAATIPNLCPSIDTSADATLEEDGGAPWTFTYAIFDSPNCEGAQLNDGLHNFTCFGSQDLSTTANPNESVELLEPGLNTNVIVCQTVNAQKTFNVLSCTPGTCPDASTAPDGGCTVRSFDCGCVDAGTTCQCGTDAGLTAALTAAGCSFDPTCNIVCDCTTLTTLTATSTCGLSPDYPAIVGPPTRIENCTGIEAASIIGTVVNRISLDGGVNPQSIMVNDAGGFSLTVDASTVVPRQVYANYTIQWTAKDDAGLVTGTTVQTITIRPKIQAAGDFVLHGGLAGDFGGPDSGQPARLQDEFALTKTFTTPGGTVADASFPCMPNQKCCQGMIWNSGDVDAGETDLERGACSGMLMSRPNVELEDGGLVNYDISRNLLVGGGIMNLALATPGSFNANATPANSIPAGAFVGTCGPGTPISSCVFARAPDTTLSSTGPVQFRGGPQLPPLPALPALPGPGGPNLTVDGSSGSVTLPSGAYGDVVVQPGGTLILMDQGKYFFQSLTIDAGSQIVAEQPDTRVYVANSLVLQSSFLASGSANSCASPAMLFTGGRPSAQRCVQRIFLGYGGTAPVTMATPFLGTLVAPSASVTFDSPGPALADPNSLTPPAQFLGSFYAPNIDVATGSELECAIDTPPLDQ